MVCIGRLSGETGKIIKTERDQSIVSFSRLDSFIKSAWK